jgi:nicotinate-nucleotide adenylyltransferase
VIGVLGGTFDPVHYGHLRPALEVYEGLGLSELRFIPCRVPPHRAPPEAPAHHRLAMVERAIAGVPGFRADARELARPGPSFSVDTLSELREEIGSGSPLLLLVGMDAFAGLHRWHRWREIPRLAHVVVAHRPGAAPAMDSPYLHLAPATDSAAGLRTETSGRVLFQQVTQLGISATGIREYLRAGRSPRFLLPESVRRYIVEHGLYRDGPAPPD